jgi:hypothetical protein
MKFLIFWGVGGGYGGISNAALMNFDSREDAEDEAYERSLLEIESYGIGDDCEDEDERIEEIDSWLDYYVIENPTEADIEKAEDYHFSDETNGQ